MIDEKLINELIQKDSYLYTLLDKEVWSAREKFPDGLMLVAAMNEEVGEFNRELLEFWAGNSSLEAVRKEGIQAMAMVLRVLSEGDSVFNFPGEEL